MSPTTLSGLTALGAEVVWTRQLSLLFGASVYTFSLILATFLAGLGLGSLAGSAIARRTSVAGVGVRALPDRAGVRHRLCRLDDRHRPADVATDLHLPHSHPLIGVADVRVRRGSLPRGDAARRVPLGCKFSAGACCGREGRRSGAQCFARERDEHGRRASRDAGLHAAGRARPSAASTRSNCSSSSPPSPRSCCCVRHRPRGRDSVSSTAVAAIGIVSVVPPTPGGLIAYGRAVSSWPSIKQYLYVAEGATASVAVTLDNAGADSFTSPARSKPRTWMSTCVSNGCSVTSPRCCIQIRARS